MLKKNNPKKRQVLTLNTLLSSGYTHVVNPLVDAHDVPLCSDMPQYVCMQCTWWPCNAEFQREISKKSTAWVYMRLVLVLCLALQTYEPPCHRGRPETNLLGGGGRQKNISINIIYIEVQGRKDSVVHVPLRQRKEGPPGCPPWSWTGQRCAAGSGRRTFGRCPRQSARTQTCSRACPRPSTP